MRFIRRKIIVTTFFDGELSDEIAVTKLLHDLKNKELVCSILVGNKPKYKKAKIVDVSESTEMFSFMVIGERSNLTFTDHISAIHLIELNTEDEITVRTKQNVTRWDLLTPGDDLFEEVKK